MKNPSKTLGQIADLVKGRLAGDADLIIQGVAPLELAAQNQITFAEKGAALKLLDKHRAAAILVPIDFSHPGLNLVRVENPRLAFTKVVALFDPTAGVAAGIHPTAVIGEDTMLGTDAAIGAGAVLGRKVVIGDRVTIDPNVVIGDGVTIGDESRIYPNATILERCRLGRRVIIHAGSVIGSDGFGFVLDKGRYVKMPQIGIVQIDDDVEIGAHNAIDRATLGKTWIKSGVKTDNLVHIAHNVVLGEHSAVAGHVGIAGSTTIGRHAAIAGQAGVGDHLKIGNHVTIGPQCAVAQSVDDRQIVSSTLLAMPHRTWLRLQKIISRLPDMFKRVRALERLIDHKLITPAPDPGTTKDENMR